MQSIELLVLITILIILAEVTYLVVKLPRQVMSKGHIRPILVDTSVLIDGRIMSVAASGFIGDTLVIPRSVIGELQFLADNADHEKRARARHGLDVVSDLQKMPEVNVEILQDGSKADEGVDERLLTLAKKHKAAICTIDYNLNKVAVVENIPVLNVNELAQSLRMAYLPGEKTLLELVQKGQDAHQAVGYLPDGTMVVVEQSNKLIGQSVEVEFIRSLQTAAGKMMFARRVNTVQPNARSKVVLPKSKPAVILPRSEPVATESPAIYHSDNFEQKLTHTDKKGKRNNAYRSNANQPKKSSRSNNNEDEMINLINKS
jgi:uncharacterized protein YacL